MPKTRNSASRNSALRSALIASALMLGVSGLSAGCLDRPVQPQSPNTSNVFVKTVQTSPITKIDLLFMIDNSISMTDKQEILKAAVPNLLARLIQPDCVDADEMKVKKLPDGKCPAGTGFEFRPINDIHIGAITSSLGSHGGTECTDARNETEGKELYKNDEARLLPTVRVAKNLPVSDPAGFLTWDGGGATEVDELVGNFRQHVGAASEHGCGYEASLEAWYRFLVDPNPPIDVVRVGDLNQPVLVAPEDNPVLLQRDAFLRSDSLVAIVMLSDENDCSILDVGSGWAVSSGNYSLSPASEVCDTKPNDECCYSCSFDPPPGCTASPRCTGTPLPDDQDRANVRCAQQKKRFGFDLLWPVQRYINGLTQPQIYDYWDLDPNRAPVPNPLFVARNGASARNPSLVFLAGIVGVPWQDLATPDTVDDGRRLVYQSAEEMRENGVWDMILGDQGDGVLPTDPLMIESIAPRSGTHPMTGEALSTNAWSNRINGNEYDNAAGTFAFDKLPPNDDLQYACVFPLTTRLDCSLEANQGGGCDCDTNLEQGKSLCIPQGSTTPGSMQHYAKAYPGTRFLEVLKGMGEVHPKIDNAIVASICPKNPVNPNEPTDADAGYNPAVGAIIDRLGDALGGQCLQRELDIDERGLVPCYVIEASPTLNDPSCARAGREPMDAQVAKMVRRQLASEGRCGGTTGVSCDAFQMCGIHQFVNPEEKRMCFEEPTPTKPGYCYIDPGQGPKAGGSNCDAQGENCSSQFTMDCPASGRRILRFVGTDADPVPAPGAVVLTACVDG